MKKLLLASVMMLATTTLARAEDGAGMTLGGQQLCSVVLGDPGNDNDRTIQVSMWSGWVLGYWSALNSQRSAWVGESIAVPDKGGARLAIAVFERCMKHPHDLFQEAIESVYMEMEKAKK